MNHDGNRMFGIGAVGCAVLLVAHFATGSPPQAEPADIGSRPAAAQRDRGAGDAEKWEAWRARRSPAFDDSREQREEKQFSETMRAHRQQPVEIVDDPGRGTGLVEIASIDDLRRLLEQGGSYAGPLPPGLESATNEAAPASPPAGGKR